jgi:AbrB family looped-hinge helix DNA binding protein
MKRDGHMIYGTARVGEKGQIVIPKEARDDFKIKTGDKVIIIGKEGKGIGIVKSSFLKEFATSALNEILGKD